MTNSDAPKDLTTGAKVFLAVAAILGLINLADFLFYGRQLTDLIVALGFALMAYGTYKNGLRRFRDQGEPARDKVAQYASGAGMLMVLGSIAAGYVL